MGTGSGAKSRESRGRRGPFGSVLLMARQTCAYGKATPIPGNGYSMRMPASFAIGQTRSISFRVHAASSSGVEWIASAPKAA